MTPEEYRQAAFEQVVKIGKATSNITRLKILYALSQGRKSVEELAKTIEISTGTTSKNLQILKKINLIKEEKDKNFVFYRLTSPKINQWLSLLIDLSEENLTQMENLSKNYNQIPSVSISELKQQLLVAEPYIVDLRPEDEFKQGHLPYAHNIPYFEINENLAALPKKQDIILYCRGRLCGIAEDVGRKLKEKGYQVVTFNNTVQEWKLAHANFLVNN